MRCGSSSSVASRACVRWGSSRAVSFHRRGLLRPGAEVAVGQAGLAFTEDAVAIHRFPGGRIPSPVVRWSARTPTRAWGSVVVAAARWRLQRAVPVMRLALHPRDLSHPAVAASLTRALRDWTGARRVGRYAALAA
jgi:hypothetical protein